MSKQENDKRVEYLYMFHAGFHEVHTAAESIGEEGFTSCCGFCYRAVPSQSCHILADYADLNVLTLT